MLDNVKAMVIPSTSDREWMELGKEDEERMKSKRGT